MRVRHFMPLLLVAALIGCGADRAVADPNGSPVVIELFTSQGCSSCPPADKLLAKISDDDSGVILLSFHVHYWDRLGWKDPYSSPSNTERQRIYAATLSGGQVFTPQAILNGRLSAVGTDEARVRKAIEIEHATAEPFEVLVASSPRGASSSVTVNTKARGSFGSKVAVFAVFFQNRSRTEVKTGENSGRTLENTHNVLSVAELGQLDASQNTARFVVPAFDADDFIVLVQALDQGQILGAGTHKLLGPATSP